MFYAYKLSGHLIIIPEDVFFTPIHMCIMCIYLYPAKLINNNAIKGNNRRKNKVMQYHLATAKIV